MHRRIRRIPLLLTVLLFAVPATAQNLVSNPTFDSNTDGWESIHSSIVVDHTTEDGAGALGAGVALGMLDNPPFFAVTGLTQCVDASPGLPVVVRGAGKAVNFTPEDINLAFLTFSAPGCDGDDFLDSTGSFFSAAQGFWMEHQMLVETLPEGVASFAVSVYFTSPNLDLNAESRFDDVYVGQATEIFADGFETGNTSSWSATVP